MDISPPVQAIVRGEEVGEENSLFCSKTIWVLCSL